MFSDNKKKKNKALVILQEIKIKFQKELKL